MEPKVDLIQKILRRNNFALESVNGNTYTIKQAKINDQNISIYYFFAIVIIGIGCLILYVGSLWGIAFLVVSIPIFNRVSKQKNRQKNNFEKQVIINANQIELIEKNKSLQIEIDSIEEISYEVDKNKNISSGIVIVKTEGDNYFPVIEIFGDDKRFVEDDIKLIAQFFADAINSENS